MEVQMNAQTNQFWIWVVVIIGLAMLAGVIILLRRQNRKYDWAKERDQMDGFEFEYYCADLLSANGFVNVEVTRSTGDYGVDILAEKEGITFAIQCKRYSKPVGIKAVQEAYAGRDYYDRMVGAVLTNQYFTKPAMNAARKLKILLWDRDYLQTLEQ
ncbi:hypothetical protein IMSAGC011_01828 [Lachnospiraceae bacterium]|nr:hypothetical protein IMSAGC011_01828 [Lachnospiraceae bacterium]